MFQRSSSESDDGLCATAFHVEKQGMRKANQALSQRGSVRVAGRVPKLTKLYLTAWEKRYMIMAAGRAGAKEMKRTVQGTQRPRGSWGETERRIGRG